ncbi:zinc finger BED domain-containing protein 4-like [Gouania willdenowi]|nr:zinc finger BED domain-containing protein 4-like [Gouania willdenowi]XP_028296829.1 zinc finger BED domain-containing protein 4-like [Gouania willdenowi]XP_028297219.1 zinc finger BED domain-containing protein 4-like [Gouania willdenowi]XP_028297471.1 zinc finger BED domain-containing protein 4-like [Gouania willdenowi]XP_028297519.1 zinc finger BED domain-containing protein 4-like [Gouania willdenowi]XP_028298545.1 zinc finger BED domain-containing protein 4-like [Gouania willdenowi]XP_02
MSGRKRSDIWNHFSEVSATKSKCNICKRILSTQGGSTSNLRRHLKTAHPTVQLAQVRGESDDGATAAAANISTSSTLSGPQITAAATLATASAISSTPAAPTTTTQTAVRPRRPQQTHMGTYITRPMDPLRQSKLDEALVKMIASDYQPFSIVEDKGFKEFTKTLDPSYTLPSRKTLSQTLLPKMYGKIRAELLEKIKNAPAVCLTTDCWTSVTTTSYMSVTCHYVQDFAMTSHLLDCFVLTDRHTSAHLASELKRVADEWGVSDKVVACVTDNASNIVAALRDHLHWDHIPCFAHVLNLVVRAALREVQGTVHKIKAVVEYFHRSTVASDKLKATQQQMGQEQLRLKQDVVTRWNSTFYMVKRFIDVKDPVISTLALINAPLSTLSTEEWEIAQETADILKPFEEVTVEVSAERFVTASKVILMARGLQRIVARHQRSPSVHEPIKKLVDSLMSEMQKRFSKVEHIEKLADATCLDPRFKKQAFVNSKAAEDTVKRITAAAAHNHPSHSEEEESQNPSVAASTGAMFWEDFDERVASTRASTSSDSATSSTSTAAMMEMRAYLAEPLLSRSSDPLAWWRMCSPVFKTLCEVMKTRLCIVATSVPSERVFSKTGQIITDRRNRLSPSKVRQLVFLNANLP